MGLKIPRLDDTTFEKLVKEARLLIGRHAVRWTDHNVHDPGITFMELFSWLAEMQIYHLNRITPAIYETFLNLVGIQPFDAVPASVEITFTFHDLPNQKFFGGSRGAAFQKSPPGRRRQNKELEIKAGDSLAVTSDAGPLYFEATGDVTLLPLSIQTLQTVLESRVIDNTAANRQEDIHFFPFGEKALEGAEFRMAFDQSIEDIDISLTFHLLDEFLGSEAVNFTSSPRLAWEYRDEGEWKPLTLKRDTTLSLNRSGRVSFTGPSAVNDNDGNYWIRCRLVRGNYEIVPIIQRVLLNTVPAIQVETVNNEILWQALPRCDGDMDMPGLTAMLKKKPINSETIVVQVGDENQEWEQWEQVDDFQSSEPDDSHYIFDPRTKEITFGNGLNGRAPLKTRTIRVSCKTTLGAGGKIPRGRTFYIPGCEHVRGKNLEDASGGKDAETIKNAKARAGKDFKTTHRAITSNDYEQLALRTPGLGVVRAKAVTGYNPNFPCISIPGAVTVVVVPAAREGTLNPVPGEAFLAAVRRHLDPCRLVTTGLYVIAPQYVKVSVYCKVKLKKKSSPEKVRQRVVERLEAFLHPLKGGPGNNGWTFGRAVYPSEIYQLIDNVEGVDYATGIAFTVEDQAFKPGQVVKIAPHALVYSGEHRVEVIEERGQS